MSAYRFQIKAEDGPARTGLLQTPRGDIRTPAFMPVGTVATVKGLMPSQVRATGADILLGNTYHLMLRPGAERMARYGGLHRFMGWDRPILTDSGGYQVMSLAKLRDMTEEGVTFRSHIDGSKHLLTPERSMVIQQALGSDIIMVFDECTPFPATHEEAAASMALSTRWAVRSKQAFYAGDPEKRALFGIVQGGIYADLRRESAEALIDIGFDGYAVGGLAVGEGQALMLETLEATVPHLPHNRPRYLMGVGKPDDIVGAVERGIDMFDCVLPTRSGRHGQAFTDEGPLNLKNARFGEDLEPLAPGLECPASRDFSKAYLHHLIRSGELLGQVLLSWHNLAYYQSVMARLRSAIETGRLGHEAQKMRTLWKKGDRAA